MNVNVELCKWVAFVLMLGDHADAYVFQDAYEGVWLWLGPMVFPLFVLSLAWSVRGASADKLVDIALRCFGWFAAAELVAFFVKPEWNQFNVLLTICAGTFVAHAIEARGHWWPVHVVIAFAAALFAEFSFVGVAFVASSIYAARHERSDIALFTMAMGCLGLWAFNQSPAALFGMALWFVLVRVPWQLPRVRGLFYHGYVAQWPALAVLRALT